MDNWTMAMKLLTFSPQDGRIWMNDKRMVMLDVASFGAMRAEIIRALGLPAARAVLMRIGFAAGVRDADLLRERWPEDFGGRALLGPQFHGLAGIVKVEILDVRRDPATGQHYGEYIWRHCAENDAHIHSHGLSTEPVCWMETGYASGFITRISGIPHLFREVSCRAMGGEICRVMEKPAAAWTDADDELACLGLLDEVRSIRGQRSGVRVGPAPGAGPVPADTPPVCGVEPTSDTAIVGESPALRVSLHMLERAAPTHVAVLVSGESGVGKELFARTLHRLSPRAASAFVAVNCAAIPDTLREAELFGVERGAFTGAVHSRAGRFERAHGGTLFLDEVATLNTVAQAKLLRALQEGEVERVGGTNPVRTDVRVVAATNVDLSAAVNAGQFREDLYFRLNVFPIHLPPLRERRDDIRLLMATFLQRYNARHGRSVQGFTLRATQALLNYDYPGNVRELQNLIERAVILADGDRIDIVHLFTSGERIVSRLYSPGRSGKLARRGIFELPASPANDGNQPAVGEIAELLLAQATEAGQPLKLPQIEGELTTELVRRALAGAHGNVSAAARALGMNRYQLAYLLKKSPDLHVQAGSRRDTARRQPRRRG